MGNPHIWGWVGRGEGTRGRKGGVRVGGWEGQEGKGGGGWRRWRGKDIEEVI